MRSAQVSFFIIDDLSLTKVPKHATKLFDARIVNQSGQLLKRLAVDIFEVRRKIQLVIHRQTESADFFEAVPRTL